MKPEEIRWKKFVIVQMKGKKLHKTKKKKTDLCGRRIQFQHHKGQILKPLCSDKVHDSHMQLRSLFLSLMDK